MTERAAALQMLPARIDSVNFDFSQPKLGANLFDNIRNISWLCFPAKQVEVQACRHCFTCYFATR